MQMCTCEMSVIYRLGGLVTILIFTKWSESTIWITSPCAWSELLSVLLPAVRRCCLWSYTPPPTPSKGKFVYSALSSLQDRSKRFTLYFPDRPVHSDTISASLGSIQPYVAVNTRRLLLHISTSVYSQVLMYTAE